MKVTVEEERDHVQDWTDCLVELSAIKDAFETGKIKRWSSIKILDIGTLGIKPLFIALMYKPKLIIGIDEDLTYYATDIEANSKNLVRTKIKLYNCSFFDEAGLNKIRSDENAGYFDFILISKTLHHLRTGKCKKVEENNHHECRKDERDCIYKFKEEEIFPKLFELGGRIIVYEYYDPTEKDDDKVRGRGGYFTIEEWEKMFKHLDVNYDLNFIRPIKEFSDVSDIISRVKHVDTVCFYVDRKK